MGFGSMLTVYSIDMAMSQELAASSSPTRLINYKQCVWSLVLGRSLRHHHTKLLASYKHSTWTWLGGWAAGGVFTVQPSGSDFILLYPAYLVLWLSILLLVCYFHLYKVLFDCTRIRSQPYSPPKTIDYKPAYRVEISPQVPWFSLWDLFDLEPINEYGTRVYCRLVAYTVDSCSMLARSMLARSMLILVTFCHTWTFLHLEAIEKSVWQWFD
jgi:hypothetical protein